MTSSTTLATNKITSTDVALASATSAADARIVADWLASVTTLLDENPYDREAWQRLARDALASHQTIARMRPFWDRLTQQFPYHPAFWETWIDEELKAQNVEYALQLLNKTFVKDFVLSPTLGVQFATAHVTPNAAFDPMQREKVIKAYELALDKTGFDYNAAPLYGSYINFLQKCHASGPYAERQKIDSIRRVYVRAIRVPFFNVEILWNDYCQFEAAQQPQQQGVAVGANPNPATGGGGPNEHARVYNAARTALKRLDVLIRSVRRGLLPMPVRSAPGEREQVSAWRAWIDWERSNPLHSDDSMLVQRRTLYAAACSLMCITHFLEPWLQNVALRERFSDSADPISSAILTPSEHATRRLALLDESAAICSRGAEILNGIPLLHLVHAELEERRGPSMGGPDRIATIFERALTSVKFGATLVYIHYMLSMRRQRGIAKARDVFKQARADARCTIELYLAAALMEYFHAAGDSSDEQQRQRQVAQKILDLGITKHHQQQKTTADGGGSSVIPFDYQRWYVLFQMLVTNDASRTRFAVERCLAPASSTSLSKNAELSDTITVEQKLQLSSLSLLYDQLQGDFDAIQQSQQKRFSLLVPRDEKLSLLLPAGVGSETNVQPSLIISKWKLFDLMPARKDDLDIMSYCELRDEAALHAPLPYGVFCGRGGGSAATIGPVVPYNAAPNNIPTTHPISVSSSSMALPPSKPMITPDDAYLIPFKPRQYVRQQQTSRPHMEDGDYMLLPGGEFAIGGSLEFLRRQLPRTFQGPFVSVSRLAEVVLASNDRLPPLQPVEYLDTGIDWLARAARDEIRDAREKQRVISSKKSKLETESSSASSSGVKRIKTEAEDEVKPKIVNGVVIPQQNSSGENISARGLVGKRTSEDMLADGGQQRDLYLERAKKMLKNA